jgi:hypothetical protein
MNSLGRKPTEGSQYSRVKGGLRTRSTCKHWQTDVLDGRNVAHPESLDIIGSDRSVSLGIVTMNAVAELTRCPPKHIPVEAIRPVH